MKVKSLKGDRKGEVDYMSFPEARDALLAGAVEEVPCEALADEGHEGDKGELKGSSPQRQAAPGAEADEAEVVVPANQRRKPA